MSFVVARMQKVKSGNLVGVGNHNQRNTDNHSNKDIDVERSHLNYDLVNRTENYKRDIEQFINDNKSSSRAVRKDAVLINEWIITSDNQFFKDKDSKEIKDYFEEVEGKDETAVCPKCGIDSIIDDSFPINDPIFLAEMSKYWFE